ncbi:MAG: hypothetical protein ACI90V_007210 [Bacillariaceae sp.]|jgi:hypothetical protein
MFRFQVTALVFISVSILLSEAFVVRTTRRTWVISRDHPSLSFLAHKDEAAVAFDEKIISRLEEKVPNDNDDAYTYDVPPLQQQIQNAVAPAANFLDDVSGGWALSYADLTPNSERTIPGQVFLATNVAYTIVGIILALRGEVLLGFLTDLCSFASFAYHYTQLQQPYGRTQDSTVKLALLLDYFLAITSILIGISYMLVDQTLPPIEGIATSILGISCLLMCWVWEKGLPYIIWHGLWHLFSAASAYYIGTSHAMMS